MNKINANGNEQNINGNKIHGFCTGSMIGQRLEVENWYEKVG